MHRASCSAPRKNIVSPRPHSLCSVEDIMNCQRNAKCPQLPGFLPNRTPLKKAVSQVRRVLVPRVFGHFTMISIRPSNYPSPPCPKVCRSSPLLIRFALQTRFAWSQIHFRAVPDLREALFAFPLPESCISVRYSRYLLARHQRLTWQIGLKAGRKGETHGGESEKAFLQLTSPGMH